MKQGAWRCDVSSTIAGRCCAAVLSPSIGIETAGHPEDHFVAGFLKKGSTLVNFGCRDRRNPLTLARGENRRDWQVVCSPTGDRWKLPKGTRVSICLAGCSLAAGFKPCRPFSCTLTLARIRSGTD